MIFLIALLGIGSLFLSGGFLLTRSQEKTEKKRLSSPIQRAIPNLPTDAPPPSYFSLDEALDGSNFVRSKADITVPKANEALPCGGYTDQIFSTNEKIAVLNNAVVLCLQEGLTAPNDVSRLLRETNPNPLVIAAPSFSAQVQNLAAANHLHKLRKILLVTCTAPEALASFLGVNTLSYADIQAGWIGTTALVDLWISDARNSWIISA